MEKKLNNEVIKLIERNIHELVYTFSSLFYIDNIEDEKEREEKREYFSEMRRSARDEFVVRQQTLEAFGFVTNMTYYQIRKKIRSLCKEDKDVYWREIAKEYIESFA
jgi:flagellar biosynthesis regulator FlbT